ncbi:MAG: fused MFS/spermidine synthase [Verrucomicrobiota bacterium]
MRKAFAFSFLVLGITSLIAQVVLIRELMIVFYGNEFFIGWALFAWLFWVGVGSIVAGRLLAEPRRVVRALIECHALSALLLPAAIVLVRCSRLVIGAMPGEVPNLLPSLGYAFAVLAPLCLVLGVQFVAGVKTWEAASDRGGLSRVVGESYVFETVGFVAGGIAFSFLLTVANEFLVAALLAWLNLMAGAAINVTRARRSAVLRLILIAVSAITAVVFFLSPRINLRTSRFRFRGQDLVESRNSIYGNLAVTRLGSQYNFYENGLLLSADREEMAAEYLAHFPMLYHPDPKSVLLIGGGFSGVLTEVLKHGPERVDYLELDPGLIGTVRKYIAPDLVRALDDPRVHTLFVDGRFYLKQLAAGAATNAYDVVIVNLPNPSTILINRFYSREFFREVRARLKPGGLLSTQLSFSPDYLSPELENLGASVYKTLAAEFPSVVILPEYTVFLIASPTARLTYDPKPLIERFEQRRIEAQFIVPKYIEYRLGTDRIEQVAKAFSANTSAGANLDQRPVACFYNLLYWMSSFHSQVARIAGRAGAATGAWLPWALAAILILSAAGPLTARARQTVRHALPALAMAVGSFSLMACEVAIILSFQVFYGYVYHKIALIIAGLMLGMAAGTWFGRRALDRARPALLGVVHLLIIGYALLYLLLSRLLAATAFPPSRALESVFLLLAAVIGGLVGFEFPVANKLYLQRWGEDHRRAGVIYGVDLLGSCAGALLVSMWILPILGVVQTLVALVLLNAVIVAVWARGRKGFP